ncbi:MAG: Penicillin-binding protein, 1A family [candidate division WWE3 bacterium GW2011_GWC1_41_7]|uniref:Penicillin-binding protein, 1A family n=1 Tax=candidate division WWE3 bacterium GW2011_GWC1_41_7 TaxID=1619119 RepID=A0A0G0XAC2_UNCKA|nr:MAG: Penicillin-binding protein, 1A family [candidate division WWE3 bacterium GW2011_GWC1_41_7]
MLPAIDFVKTLSLSLITVALLTVRKIGKAYIKESVFRFWSTLYPLLSKGLTEGMKFLITRSKNILRIISTKIKSIPEGYVNELRDQYEMFRNFINDLKNNKKPPKIKIKMPYKKLNSRGVLNLKIFKTFISRVTNISILKIIKRFNDLYTPGTRVFVWGIIFALVFIGLPIKAYSWYRELPNPDLLLEYGSAKSTKILSRDGELLYEIYVDRKYDPVALKNIPQHVIQSTIAVEDDMFFEHNGVRPLSIIRAAKATILDDDIQGGSTITQQLVKNVLLSSEQTMERKIKEAVLAIMVEKKYTKEQILELYFNNIPYGGTAWGIQSASQKYFGKDVGELDMAESSLLAGLPSAPTTYSPFNGNYEISKQRQRVVLNRMVGLGYISQDEADKAYEKELNLVPQIEYIRAPHFVEYVRDELTKIYGSRMVNFGGLTVTTTLDLDLQEKSQDIVKEEVEKNIRLNITNGAAVVLDPNTGEILSYVGSKDYFIENWGAFDVLRAYRQPGSAIKVLTYSLAFKNGLAPWNFIEDSPVVYKNDWETYKPVNYDGRYHGKVSLRSALANSYNIPAVKLAHKIGPDNIVSLGQEMGLNNWSVDGSYGISITLGGKEVRPLDLANVYATLARGGVYKETTPFISIKDNQGYEIYKNTGKEKRVLSEEIAYLITNILADYYARLPAFGVNNFLSVKGHDIAVKTGTTDLKRDNWTIGYTPSYVVAVWTGNNNNTPMNKNLASGLSGAAPIWNRIMSYVLDGTIGEKFNVPEGIAVKTEEECNLREIFIKGTKVPETLCPDDDDKDNRDEKGNNDKNKKKRD